MFTKNIVVKDNIKTPSKGKNGPKNDLSPKFQQK